MALPLVFRRAVGRDLAAAYAWYEKQRVGLGEQFLTEINVSFDTIEEFPKMFAAVHAEVRRAIVSRFPYAIFYRVESNRIVIFTVLHTARDPRVWPMPRKRAR